jgi:hypothetical protein
MKKKSYLINFTLLIISLVISFIIAEIGLRFILFSNIPFLTDLSIVTELRQPQRYADALSEEEFAKLSCRLSKEECGQNKVHPLLGWTHNFSPDNYLHDKKEFIGTRRPVLLYGDSFAYCMGKQTCFQDILNTDKEFSKDHYLLNYGVTAYGLDQIYLLFHKSVDHYDNPFVVFSFFTKDIDRSIVSFFSGQKPRFRVENNMLKFEKPLMIEPDTFYSKNPPQIKSYLYRLILHTRASNYLPRNLVSFLKKDNYYRQKKIKLNEKIILEVVKELRAKELDYVFLIFHHGGNLLNDDWRDSFLKHILDENKVPYIWSKELIVQNSKINNIPINDFFIPDGHPATVYNRVIAKEIKKYLITGYD